LGKDKLTYRIDDENIWGITIDMFLRSE